MQEPPLYNPREERLQRLESKLDRLLQDYRIGESLTGSFPVSESHMGLRRADGSIYYEAGTLSPPSATQTGTFNSNVLFTTPFYVASPVFVNRLSFHVATSDPGDARLGIYESDGNLYPTKLIVDGGEVSVGSGGWKDYDFAKVRLRRGLKWIAYHTDANPVLSYVPAANAWAILGRTQSRTAWLGQWYKAGAYAALPSMFPTGALTTQNVLLVLVRLL